MGGRVADYRDSNYEWDLEKSDDVCRRHGFDFSVAIKIFENETYIDARVDDRSDPLEERIVAIGRTLGLYITVVYTMRGDRKRIITAWRSHRLEIDEYVRIVGYEQP